jgi:hypothetical protein
MEHAADDGSAKSIPRGLVQLLQYHTAKLSRDDGEWMCWGAPYVQMCAVILYVDGFNTLPKSRYEILFEPVIISDPMSPSPNSSPPGQEEDTDPADDPAWSVIRHNHEYFEGIVATLRKAENKETLKILLGMLICKNFEMGNYDSRVRAVVRHIFSIVGLPKEHLFMLESQYMQSTGPYFNQADISTLGSVVTPYRSLQVCAVALSTGVVMYGVGVCTAPAILMALQQLIRTGLMSTSAVQAIVGSGFVDAAGLAHLLVGLPELCSSAVAGTSAVAGLHSASKRMLHRTSPLNQFTLSPLFLPTVRAKQYSDDTNTDTTTTTDGLNRQSCLVLGQKDELGAAACAGHGGDGEDEDIFLNSSLVVIEEVEDTSAEIGLRPVYFLIPGHIGNESDLRDIFGAVSDVEDHAEDDCEGEAAVDKKEESTTPTGVGEKIDAAAEVTIETVLDVVEEDMDKINDLVKETVTGSAVPESAFLTSPHLVRKNWWRRLFPRGEEYILQWERTELADLNKKIRNVLEGKLISHAVNAALAHFALTALWSSFSWANFVLDEIAELDGPWAVALDRSKQAGRMLARLLLSNKFCQIESEEIMHRDGKAHDNHSKGSDGVVIVNGDTFSWDDCAYENIRRGRPVTLIGYSMGARVIYHCLAELDACVPNVVGRGIVENVVLMG